MNVEKITAFLEEMIEHLTFTRVALLFILISIAIAMLSIFEHRAAIFTTVYQNAAEKTFEPWVLSDQSKKTLVTLTDRQFIGAVVLVDVDLKKNQQTTKFVYVKDRSIRDEVVPIVEARTSQPFFDRDQKNTSQMVAMLNNEFQCVSAANTTTSKYVPGFEKSFSSVCRVAVPPFFGAFTGYLAVWTTKPIDDNTYIELKIEATRIAVDIYMRDVEHKQI